MFDNSSSCHNTYPSQNRMPIFISLLYFSSIIRVFINSPLEKSQSSNLTSLEKSSLHQILDHTEPNCSPCVVFLLVFTSFITNCYIYENSTVWIILPLSKFLGKIGGVTTVPLKTQSPSQNFLGHIYPSCCLSVYTTICYLCCGFPLQVIWNIFVLYMISQHLVRRLVLRFVKIGLHQFSLYTSNCPHDRVSRVSQFCLPSKQINSSLNSSAHVIG